MKRRAPAWCAALSIRRVPCTLTRSQASGGPQYSNEGGALNHDLGAAEIDSYHRIQIAPDNGRDFFGRGTPARGTLVAIEAIMRRAIVFFLVANVTVAQQPLFRVVDLDVGATERAQLSDGKSATVRLLSTGETRDRVRSAIRDARVDVEINGASATLSCGNYRLPVAVGGVQVDCEVTKAYYRDTNADHWSLVKDARLRLDRKSTRLNSSHLVISYAVFCLQKKDDVAGVDWHLSTASRTAVVLCFSWIVAYATLQPSAIRIFFFNDTATTEIYTLSLHDALPI